jgi:hypothetical protein
MAKTATQNDLAAIVGNLSKQIAEIDSTIALHQAKVVQLELDLQSWGRNKANYAGDLQTATTNVQRLLSDLQRAQTDLTLCKGTSVEAVKRQERDALQANLQKWQNELDLLHTSADHDTQAEIDTQTAISEIGLQLDMLQHDKADLEATRLRFSQEQCSHLKQIGLEHLRAIDNEISAGQAALDQLNSRRMDAQRQIALDLSPWPQECLRVLGEHATLKEHPDVVAVKLRKALVDYLDEHASELSHAAIGLLSSGIDVTYISQYGGLAAHNRRAQEAYQRDNTLLAQPSKYYELEKSVADLDRFITEQSALDREYHARQLLKSVTQP